MARAIAYLPVLLLCAPALCRDYSFAFRDTAHFYHPLFAWVERETAARELPLWNPHANYGTSLVGEGSSSLFYPGKVLFLGPGEFSAKWKWYIVAHLLLAAEGMLFATRRQGLAPFAGALAAVSYACGGGVLFQYCNVPYLVGAAWMPWGFALASQLVSQRAWTSAVGLGIILALMILGGDPQAAYHLLLATACFTLLAWLWPNETAGPPPSRHRYELYRLGGLVALAGATACLLAAVQILPTAETSRESDRAAYHAPRNIYEALPLLASSSGRRLVGEGLFNMPQPETHANSLYSFAFAPWHLPEYLWPKFSGSYFPVNHRWLGFITVEPRLWSPTVYAGLLPLLCAITALRLRHGPPWIRWLSGCVVVAVLGSFGPFGLTWFVGQTCIWLRQPQITTMLPDARVGGVYWLMVTLLPTYANFRFPAKLLTFAACPLALLAAEGMQRLAMQLPRRFLFTCGLIAVSSLALSLALAVAKIPWQHIAVQVGPDTAFGPFVAEGARWELAGTFLHTGVVAGLIWFLVGRFSSMTMTRLHASMWLLTIVTAGELAMANRSLIVVAPSSIWRETPRVAELIARDQRERGSVAPRVRPLLEPDPLDPAGWTMTSSSARLDELNRFERHTAATNHAPEAGLHLVEALTSQRAAAVTFWFRRFQRNEEAYWGNYWIMPRTRRLDFLPQWEEITDDDFTAITQCRLYRHRQPFPRAWIVHRLTVLPELTSLDPVELNARGMEVLGETPGENSQRRDFREEAVIESNDPRVREFAAALDGNATSMSESCRIKVDEPNHVELEVTLTSPGVVVLGDTLAPGWRCFVSDDDGGTPHPLPIYRANRCFRGLLLPAGHRYIRFEYAPTSIVRGAWLSMAGWIIVCFGAVVGLVRRGSDTSR